MAKENPTFNYEKCIACRICAQVCPVSCLEMSLISIDKWPNAYPQLVGNTCIGCGFCARDCPTLAIAMVPTAVPVP